MAIRITKPRIPESVRKNYESVEEQKTKLMITSEQQKVMEKEEETLQMQMKMRAQRDAEVTIIDAQKQATVAMIEAEKQKNISVIRVQQELAEKEGKQHLAIIEAEMLLATEKSKADALLYTLETEAKGFHSKLSPEFLLYSLYNNLANNTKFYFGSSIPKAFAPLMNDKQKQIFKDGKNFE